MDEMATGSDTVRPIGRGWNRAPASPEDFDARENIKFGSIFFMQFQRAIEMLEKMDDIHTGQSAVDTAMMERCIRLSATSVERGEMPFAALFAATTASSRRPTGSANGDVTHAELVAICAQKKLGRSDLRITRFIDRRALRDAHTPFETPAASSPSVAHDGRLLEWNVLGTWSFARDAEAFGAVPEVIAGLSQREAERSGA
jgi:hypothetical protein